mgnify:CR=1 FL=1
MQFALLVLDPVKEVNPARVTGLQVLLDNDGPCLVPRAVTVILRNVVTLERILQRPGGRVVPA